MKAKFEALWTLETNSFNASIQEKRQFDVPLHYHPEYELTYILQSRGTRYVGNSFEPFKENDLVLLGPDLPHCWKNNVRQKGMAKAIVIHWDKNFLGRDWVECKEFDAIKKMFHHSKRGVKFKSAAATEFKNNLIHLTRLSPFERLISFLQILQSLAATSDHTVFCSEDFTYDLNYVDNGRVNIAYQYVKKNFANKIALADVAKQVNMGEESFSRFFSRVVRKPFFYFLNEHRINHACRLLQETDKNVAQICFTSGFESLPFFFRQFKKMKNCTPKKYRFMYKQAASADV